MGYVKPFKSINIQYKQKNISFIRLFFEYCNSTESESVKQLNAIRIEAARTLPVLQTL